MIVQEIMDKIDDIRETIVQLHTIRMDVESLSSGQAAYIVDAEVYLNEYIQELGRKKVQ